MLVYVMCREEIVERRKFTDKYLSVEQLLANDYCNIHFEIARAKKASVNASYWKQLDSDANQRRTVCVMRKANIAEYNRMRLEAARKQGWDVYEKLRSEIEYQRQE